MAFSGGFGNLPRQDCHPAGQARSWGSRWASRDPDIHSGLVGAVFLRIRAPSYVVQTGLLDGWYPANASQERLKRASRGPPVGLGGRVDAKGEPRSSRPRASAPRPPLNPSIALPPRDRVSAGSSPHLPLVIILREIERENCLRRRESRRKREKSGGSGDREERATYVKNKAHMTGQTAPSGDFPATGRTLARKCWPWPKRNPRRSEDLFSIPTV